MHDDNLVIHCKWEGASHGGNWEGGYVQQPFAPVIPNNGTTAMLRDRLVQRFWAAIFMLECFG